MQHKTKTKVYKLEFLSASEDYASLEISEECYVSVDLEKALIVSVPPTMSEASANELLNKLNEKIDKSVILVTHNVQFMKVRRLPLDKEKEIFKQIKDRKIDGKE